MQIVADVLTSLSALVAAGNLAGILSALAAQRRGATRGFSCAPLLSWVLGLLAWMVGHAELGLWPLVPTFFDVGTWTVPVAVVQHFRSRREA